MIDGLRVPVNVTSRESLRMFDLADIWATRTGEHVRLVSANDHVHSRRSAHYEGLALDFQSSDPDGLSALFKLAGYRVLWKVPGHFGHVHVEEVLSGSRLPLPSADLSAAASAKAEPTRQTMSRRPRSNQRVGG